MGGTYSFFRSKVPNVLIMGALKSGTHCIKLTALKHLDYKIII